MNKTFTDEEIRKAYAELIKEGKINKTKCIKTTK